MLASVAWSALTTMPVITWLNITGVSLSRIVQCGLMGQRERVAAGRKLRIRDPASVLTLGKLAARAPF